MRVIVSWLLLVPFLATSLGLPALAADTATFSGTILDPSGSPAGGFVAVLKDVASGREFRSAASGADGAYQVQVPVGGRYQLEAVFAPDGTRLPVQQAPPIAVRVPGTIRLDVQFRDLPPAPGAAPPAAASEAPPSAAPPAAPRPDRDRDPSALPWWKKPGGIVAIVLGTGAVAAAVGGGGGKKASPSQP